MKPARRTEGLTLMAVGLLLGYLVANGSHCGNMLWCSGSSSRTIALQQLVLNAGPGSEAAAAQQQPADQEGRSKKWAYAFYVTAPGYLCAALVNAKRLRGPLRATPQADIVIMHSTQLGGPKGYASPVVGHVMQQLQQLGAVLKPVEPLLASDGGYFKDSLTKLRVFELVEYDKVIFFDADGLAMRNMDHLFLLPPARVAMPRSHWEWSKQPGKLASHFMVIEPRAAAVPPLVAEAKRTGLYDMDVLYALYGRSCVVLPNEYGVLSAAFTDDIHAEYADGDQRPWDSKRMMREAYYIHFTGVVPKPWDATRGSVEAKAAEIKDADGREAWASLYTMFWDESKACKQE